jgi:hypothetical protein
MATDYRIIGGRLDHIHFFTKPFSTGNVCVGLVVGQWYMTNLGERLIRTCTVHCVACGPRQREEEEVHHI